MVCPITCQVFFRKHTPLFPNCFQGRFFRWFYVTNHLVCQVKKNNNLFTDKTLSWIWSRFCNTLHVASGTVGRSCFVSAVFFNTTDWKLIVFFSTTSPPHQLSTQLTSLELQYVSPKLLMCRDLELAVPGTYDPNQAIIRIQSIAASLQVITSKQRPRKLTIMGKIRRKLHRPFRLTLN